MAPWARNHQNCASMGEKWKLSEGSQTITQRRAVQGAFHEGYRKQELTFLIPNNCPPSLDWSQTTVRRFPPSPEAARFNGCSHLPAPPQTTQNSSGLAAALQKRYHVLRGTPPLGNQQDRFFLWFYGGFLFLYAFFFSFFLKGVLSYKALQRNSRTCCNTETKWTNSTDSYSTGWTG